MSEDRQTIETSAEMKAVWQAWSDVANWPTWNAGVTSIELRGRFEEGTTFAMTLPDGDVVESSLIAVNPPYGFTDQTIMGDVRVVVDHRCEETETGRTRITYTTSVTGPDAQDICSAVTADFPEVLAALVKRVEAKGSEDGSETLR